MDKYNEIDIDNIPSRSIKNQELYKQIYNAYDEFENLVVPSNAKEINLSNLKKEISSRDEYRRIKDFGDITNNKIIRKEMVQEEQKKETEIYDINVLIKNAVENNVEEEVINTSDSEEYLKKLKLDDIDITDLAEEDVDIDEELMKTANLSLDLLSDLKGENDDTLVNAQAVTEEDDSQFYSGKYKFSNKDFDDHDDDDEKDEIINYSNKSGGKFFLKVFLIVFGILLIVAAALFIV